MPNPLLIVRSAAMRVLVLLDPPEPLRQRGVYAGTGVATATVNGNAGRHVRPRL